MLIAQIEIIYRGKSGGENGGAGGGDRRRCVLPRANRRRGRDQRRRQGRRRLPIGRGQEGVARRHGEAVRLPDRRHPDDGGRKIEIGGHAADDGELLPILFPEQRDIGRDLVEQFGDDSGDAIEMPRPGGTAQRIRQPRHLHAGRGARRNHGSDVRRPEDGRARRRQQRRIGRLLPGIAIEILAHAELQRIDEDRHHDMVGAAPRGIDQRQMAGVQRPHRRHQRDARAVPARTVWAGAVPARIVWAGAVPAQGGDGGPQRGDGTDGLHGGPPEITGSSHSKAPAIWASTYAWKVPATVDQSPPTPTADAAAGPHRIVFANEKGGTGKSTCAVHVAVALASMGARVAGLDLDHRQRTFHRYLENRVATGQRRGIDLPTPRFDVLGDVEPAALDERIAALSENADFLVIDTPGRDDPLARHVATSAHTLVTPMNDSFVDFDLIGQVDAESFKVRRPSFYAELIWNARKARAISDGGTIDWVVLRNRIQHLEARNMRRVGDAMADLSRRVGFRVVPGLSERVVYRELFPSGLTLLDRGHLGELGTSHIAARQELREMMAGLALPALGADRTPAAAMEHA